MSVRRRRRLLDRSLRHGEEVAIGEIVEAYCEFETTPRGRVPTTKSIGLVRKKAAEAEARHLLKPEPENGTRSARSVADTLPHANAMRRSEGSLWYILAVGDDVRLVETYRDVTVIRRLGGSLLACTPRERAQELRRLRRANVHVFDSPRAAVAAFGVFQQQ